MIIFVSSQKGGTGKSTLSRLLTDYYRQRDIPTAAFDANVETSSFANCYATKDPTGAIAALQNPLLGCATLSMKEKEQRDALIDLASIDAHRIVIDLPGGAVSDIEQILGNCERFIQAFADFKVDTIVAIPISTLPDACSGVMDTIAAFGKIPRYVVVKNRIFGRLDQFNAFDHETDERYGLIPREAVEQRRGEVSAMPALDLDTYKKISEGKLTIARAADSDKLTTTDRIRVRYWREEFAEDIKGTVLAA